MTDSELAVRDLICHLGRWGPNNSVGRELICTPFGGNYSTVAGWVIAVNGSPPRGILLFLHDYESATFIETDGRSRKLSERQAEIVKMFVDEHLQPERVKYVLLEDFSPVILDDPRQLPQHPPRIRPGSAQSTQVPRPDQGD